MRRFVLAAAMIGCAAPVAADPLHLNTEDYPPFNYVDPGTRKVTGISVDILAEALRRTAITGTMTVLPWQRAYAEALGNADTCVFSTTVTDERKPLFKWVGPLTTNDWTLFARADSTIALKTLDDAKPYRIGGYQGDAAGEFMKSGGFTVDAATRDELNPAKLDAGRIDLWVTGKLVGPYYAKSQGIVGLKQVFTINHEDLALACNKGVPDATITALSMAVDAMKADGTAAGIEAKYR
jgi:polar amino acid transport system substrate-binding protein